MKNNSRVIKIHQYNQTFGAAVASSDIKRSIWVNFLKSTFRYLHISVQNGKKIPFAVLFAEQPTQIFKNVFSLIPVQTTKCFVFALLWIMGQSIKVCEFWFVFFIALVGLIKKQKHLPRLDFHYWHTLNLSTACNEHNPIKQYHSFPFIFWCIVRTKITCFGDKWPKKHHHFAMTYHKIMS